MKKRWIRIASVASALAVLSISPAKAETIFFDGFESRDRNTTNAAGFDWLGQNRTSLVIQHLTDGNVVAEDANGKPDEISRRVAAGAHAVIITDKAGWHKSDIPIPDNITILLMPSYSPELDPVENIWQFIRQTYLSN